MGDSRRPPTFRGGARNILSPRVSRDGDGAFDDGGRGTMVRVKVTQEGHPYSELVIEQSVTIGRTDGCGLRLDKSTVSSKHAELVLRGGQLFLRDVGSTNGTTLNGQKVEPHIEKLLAKGDKVVISTFEIVVTETNSPLEPDTKDLPAKKDEPIAAEMTIAVSARVPSPLANLARLKHAQPRLVLASKERRAVFELGKTETTVGREATCDVVIDQGTVSKRHAEIRLLDGTFFVRDLGSQNGTFIDGNAVVGPAAPLKSNQALRFGTVSCLFLTRPPEGSESHEEQAAAQVARLLVTRGAVPPGQMESLQAMVRTSGRALAELAVTAGVVEPEAWSKLRAQADVIEMVQTAQPGPKRLVYWLVVLGLAVLAIWAGAHWWPRK
jgi:pSer/pThr/pTyr-binding forkhead associated (FHA) protein